MPYRFPTQDELLPSEAELEAAKKAQAAQQAKAWGGGIGTALGGAAGLGLSALIGAGTGGAGLVAAPELMSIGAGLGGVAGDMIGGSIGDAETEKQNDIVNAAELERQKKLYALKLRQEALDRLENTG